MKSHEELAKESRALFMKWVSGLTDADIDKILGLEEGVKIADISMYDKDSHDQSIHALPGTRCPLCRQKAKEKSPYDVMVEQVNKLTPPMEWCPNCYGKIQGQAIEIVFDKAEIRCVKCFSIVPRPVEKTLEEKFLDKYRNGHEGSKELC